MTNNNVMQQQELKQQILSLVKDYYKEVHGVQQAFIPGKTKVNYGGRYFDAEEMVNLVDSLKRRDSDSMLIICSQEGENYLILGIR